MTTRRELGLLSDRAGTIAKKATKLAEDLRAAGRVDDARKMADIASRAVEVDGHLYLDSQP